MEIVHIDETESRDNSEVCHVTDFPTLNGRINGAGIKIDPGGRYPTSGTVRNRVCTMLYHVIAGNGSVTSNGNKSHFISGEVILIEPYERYFWQAGDKGMELFVVTTPPWTPEQHEQEEPPEMPDWVAPEGPWCLKEWIPLNIPNPNVETCLLPPDHSGQCRSHNGRYHDEKNSLLTGRAKMKETK